MPEKKQTEPSKKQLRLMAAKKRKTRRAVLICAAVVLVIIGVCAFKWLGGGLSGVTLRNETDPVATITMQDGSKIYVELYPDMAPNTVANFIALANSGFYDGLIFHRVISDFMIQGGDPEGTGRGGPGYNIAGEFSANGYTENTLSHTRGVISMARSQAYNSAGSQFFIVHKTSAFLDGNYAAFGMVLRGMDTVDKIAAVSTDSNDRPLTDQIIKSIRVDTKGIEYSAEKIGG